MPQFSVNATRIDPYKNFKFRVMWDQRYVAGVSRISALRRSTVVVDYRDGSSASSTRRSPGRTTYEPITLERGVTHDPEFERWANKVWDFNNAQAPNDQRTTEVSLGDFRKNIVIDLFNEAGQRVISYQVFRCWVAEYQALPDLDANSSEVAIESITLQHEGWIRDPAVVEPKEPTFSEP
jgi:phage tail-like protein